MTGGKPGWERKEKIKITFDFPEPEPDPPDYDCMLCGETEKGWHRVWLNAEICSDCIADVPTHFPRFPVPGMAGRPFAFMNVDRPKPYRTASVVLFHLEKEIANRSR